MTALHKIAQKTLKILTPPKDLSLVQWANKYRHLSPEASSESGKWKTTRVEVARGVMEAVTDSSVSSITVVACTQLLKTELLNNAVGYYIHQDPAPILLVQPTDRMAESWSKDRLTPMLRDSPVLRKIFGDKSSRKTNNTISHKIFTGGHITITGANSPANLASRPIRIVLFDEVDKYPDSAGVEGDVVSLAEARAATFWNRKFIRVCSPTVTDSSKIWDLYQQSDKRKYYVKCPHCEFEQTLEWEGVNWDKESDGSLINESVHYQCVECKSKWFEQERMKVVQKGIWIATTVFKGHAGFHVNKIASPWQPLHIMVDAFLRANKKAQRGDTQDLKTFINTQLAETFDEGEGERIEENDLLARVENYEKVPDKVKLLTCGVDIQRDRIEGEICGWGIGKERWGIEYFVFYGNTAEEAVWEELYDKLTETFEGENGMPHKISCTCIDTGGGGGQTDMTYRFCKKNQMKRIYAIKGANVFDKPIVSKPTNNNALKVRLYSLGTDTAKGEIYARLKIHTEGEGYWHFPNGKGYDNEYFSQLTSEQLVTKFKNGRKTHKWEKIRQRNEALDCAVYSLAALHIYSPTLSVLKNGVIAKSGGQSISRQPVNRD